MIQSHLHTMSEVKFLVALRVQMGLAVSDLLNYRPAAGEKGSCYHHTELEPGFDSHLLVLGCPLGADERT